MKRAKTIAVALGALLALLAGCSGAGKATAAPPDGGAEAMQRTEAPPGLPDVAFSGDTALMFAAAQVGFGPRVPGTEAHARCVAWLVETLRSYGADNVRLLEGPGLKNIFASFKAQADSAPTILLLAHYDTRPWADADPNPDNRQKPLPGANDGASGVAVLLEVARQLERQRPAAVNVDLLLTDAEDSGLSGDDTSWCKGSQHFAANLPYTPSALPAKAVLLDMVGGTDARFHREWFSDRQAPSLTNEIWNLAGRLGMQRRFPQEVGMAVTDDHLPLMRAGIPAIDIIENQAPSTGGFNARWHTMADDVDGLSAQTLADVGRLVMTFIHTQK